MVEKNILKYARYLLSYVVTVSILSASTGCYVSLEEKMEARLEKQRELEAKIEAEKKLRKKD